MWIAARTPVQVGIVPWPAARAVTVLVKRTFDLVPRGVGGPSQDQDPLRLDARAGDAVIHPSDFAPTKWLCDVVVVGQAVTDGVGPVRIVLEPLRKLGEHGGHLSARPGVGRHGDPTDSSVSAVWTTPSFDFEAFQCAPRDQRVPTIALPLEIVVDHGDVRFVSRIEGPAPEAIVIDQSGWRAPALVGLRADLLTLDPRRRRVAIVWRGVVSLPEGTDPLIAVEVDAPIRSFAPRDMHRWPRAEAIEPSVLRRLAALAVSGGPRGTVAMDSDEETAESTLTLQVEQAVVAPAVVEQGRLRPANVEAHILEEPTPSTTRDPRGTNPDAEPITQPRPRISPPVQAFQLSPSETGPPLKRDTIPPEDALVGTVSAPLARAPAARALPFVRSRGDTRPIDAPRPAATPGANDPLVATARVAPIDSPVLPFLPAPPAPPLAPTPAPRPAPSAPEDVGTGTVTLDVRSVLAILGDEGVDPRTAAGSTPARAATPFAPTSATPFGRARPTPSAVPPPAVHAAPAQTQAPPVVAPPVVAPPLVVPSRAAEPAAPGWTPEPARPGTGVLLGVAARLGAREEPPPAGTPPLARAIVEPSADRVQGLSAEQFAEIKALLWSGREGRRATLTRFGLSELSWRLVEKRFAGDLARRRPEEAGAVLSRLRAAVRSAPAPSGEDA